MKTNASNSTLLDMVEEELHNVAKVKDISVTIQEFNKLKYPEPKSYTSKKISAVRKKLNVSQAVFAHLLNVKTTTVQKWERGVNSPSGSSARLLELFEKKGIGILSDA
jgi:putative transcriptional regulator